MSKSRLSATPAQSVGSCFVWLKLQHGNSTQQKVYVATFEFEFHSQNYTQCETNTKCGQSLLIFFIIQIGPSTTPAQNVGSHPSSHSIIKIGPSATQAQSVGSRPLVNISTSKLCCRPIRACVDKPVLTKSRCRPIRAALHLTGQQNIRNASG